MIRKFIVRIFKKIKYKVTLIFGKCDMMNVRDYRLRSIYG